MTREMLGADFSAATAAELAPHWRAAFENFWSPRGGRIYAPLFAPHEPPAPRDADEGYQSLESLGAGDRRAEFLSSRESYLRDLASDDRPRDALTPAASAYREATLRRMKERARARGVELVCYLSPLWTRAPRPGPGFVFLPFDSPRDYPELYRFESRFDQQHLTAAAAETFTRLLAGAFERAERRPPSAPPSLVKGS
jgi:hypothetical protein